MRKSKKIDKLPSYKYTDVHAFYVERIAEGIPVTKIAREYNLKEGKNYAESTLRNKYEDYERQVIGSLAADEIMKRERRADLKEMRLDQRQQQLLRREAFYKSEIKRASEIDLVAEICKAAYGDYDSTIDVKLLKVMEVDSKSTKNSPFIVMGDVHAGYEYDGFYNDAIFLRRMKRAFDEIYSYIKKEKPDRINLLEMGDQIEGTGLRKSQLAYTSQMMTQQAAMYEEVFSELLFDLAGKVPDTEIVVYFITSDNHSELRAHNTGPKGLKDHFAENIGRSLKREIETAHKYGGLLNIEFNISDTFFLKTEEGQTIFAAHGHGHSKNMEALPKQIYDDLGETPDIIITGHWHQFRYLTRQVKDGFMGATITSPSIVGDTDFSAQIHLSSLPGILTMEIGESAVNATFIPVED